MNDQLSVVIVAGGMGSRMQNPVPKQFLPLLGKPVLRWSVDCFAALPMVSELVVVLPPEFQVEGSQILHDVHTSIPLKIVEGG
ncbi:MAG TPA: 2-C-methyl-D-erythritol 4-phosphate cytidylyltransferase, partial [Candidatus Ozemobacteraceae bacterium]|nr:2-C-methyl-D-erythritol 4-phosphate cytidylyltransferase [Candidatus Ozemobacteraceae bacterium]